MHRLVRILTLLFAVAWLWPLGGTASPLPPPAPPLDKISPWVLQATADDNQTDFLVILTGQADLSPAYALLTKQARGRWVYETLWETAQRSQAWLRAWLDAQAVPYRSFYVVNLIHVQVGDRALVEALAARSDVARIEANPRIQNVAPQPVLGPEPSSPGAIEWNISHVGAPGVWAMGYTGQGIVVGGQDTGYDWDHPALINQYREQQPGYGRHDFNWHDAVHSDGGVCGFNSPQPCDDHGHGTHTMGIAVGDDGGANRIGMAPGARWIGCRNMNQGVGTPVTYLECFEFFLAPYPVGGIPGDGNPDLAPDVTNNSWACPPAEGCSWDTLQAAVEAHRAAGIMTVTSAGNGGSACSTVAAPPAIYDASYSVGATNSSDNIAGFSSRGPVTAGGSGRLKPDISAPGVSIRSSTRGGGYQGDWQGTSMASPHVAGAVALAWSAQPALRNQIDQTEEVINTTALPRYSTQCGDPPNTVPNNVYGWGRLDVLAAVNEALAIGGFGGLEGTASDEESTPVVGAEIEAAFNATQSWATTSGAGGLYSLTLYSGTYTVTARATGFMPYLTTGVTVTADSTTTLNITLLFTPTYVVSGHVWDALTSLPLSATVSLPGSEVAPVQTNPATGFYSLTAPLGRHELRAETPFHFPQSREIVLTGDRTEDFALEPYCLLAVDDDGGSDYEAYYTDALDRLGFSYNLTMTPPDLAALSHYQGVVWLTGNQGSNTLTAADRSNLAAYLDGAGRLFLSGQDIGFDIGDSAFYQDYLHAAYGSDGTSAYSLTGLDFLSGIDLAIQGGDGADNQSYPSDVEPVNGGVAVYVYPSPHLYGGVAYSGTHRTVYFSFGYEAINNQSDRDAAMGAVLGYLGVCGEPEGPEAGFVSSSPDVFGVATILTNTTRGTPWISYAWDFGDEMAPSFEANPTHLYAQPGLYTVVLTATSQYDRSSYSETVVVESGCAPVWGANFAYDPPEPLVGQVVTFSSTVARSSQPITYTWDFGDGGVGSGQVITHSYAVSDVYTAVMTATNCAETAVATATHAVTVPAGCTAVAGVDFVYEPPEPLVGQVATFSGTVATSSQPMTYTWDFGNSGLGSGQVVTHTFPLTATVQTYTVTLTVSNACPSQETAEKALTIRPRHIYLPIILRDGTP